MAGESKTTDLSSLRIQRGSESSGGMKKIVIILLVVVVLAGGGYIIFGNRPVEVETMTVVMTSSGGAESVLTGQGYVVAQRKAAISSKATGRLEALYVIEGDKVKAGTVIGRIESNDVQANYDQQKAQIEVIKANLTSAQAELEEAEIAFKRQQSLRNEKVGTQADYDAAQNRYKRAMAQIQSIKASIISQEALIRSTQVQVENTIIRAPFDGTILSKNANVGEVITALGAAAGARGAVVTIADMNSLEVEADVSESAIQKVSEGQSVEISVSAISDKKYHGIVNKIIPTADRGKGTVQVKIKFNDIDERVLPEMGAKVNFLKKEVKEQVQETPKVLVPTNSIVSKNGQNIVYIVNDKTAKEVIVKVGEKFGEFTEIKQGISDGVVVIKNPSEKISSGSAISIKENQ